MKIRLSVFYFLVGFSHEAGDVEDVVDAGEDGEGGYHRVDGREVDAAELGVDGGDKDEDDAGDLDECARLCRATRV